MGCKAEANGGVRRQRDHRTLDPVKYHGKQAHQAKQATLDAPVQPASSSPPNQWTLLSLARRECLGCVILARFAQPAYFQGC